jgi:type II secretory pathway pseudopilin PulG
MKTPPHHRHRRRPRGISVLEIALMLLIVSLTTAAVFKGQDLVFSARTKSLMAQTEQARVAFLGFQDRFRALPGDYRDAPANIAGVTYHGNNNGVIEIGGTPTGPNGVANEDEIVWNHMSKAGFYPGVFEYLPANPAAAIPRNAFGGFVGFAVGNDYGSPGGPAQSVRHTIKTGNQIPVQYLAEMDLKIDDGNALRGSFQFSNYAYAGAAPVGPPSASGCADTSGNWRTAAATRPVNCGGATLM